jgi:hypothetical protein
MMDLFKLFLHVLASLFKSRAKLEAEKSDAAPTGQRAFAGKRRSERTSIIPIGCFLFVFIAGSFPCPFRKSHPAWIGVMGENHRIILGDVCGLARARNVCSRPVQVAEPA